MTTFMAMFADAVPLVLFAQAKKNADPPLPMWPAILIMMVLFYFILMRPEKRKRQELEQQLQNLKQNDQVVTYGGIFGTVVNATKDGEFIVIRVDDNNNTRLRVLRSAVSRILSEEGGKDVGKEK